MGGERRTLGSIGAGVLALMSALVPLAAAEAELDTARRERPCYQTEVSLAGDLLRPGAYALPVAIPPPGWVLMSLAARSQVLEWAHHPQAQTAAPAGSTSGALPPIIQQRLESALLARSALGGVLGVEVVVRSARWRYRDPYSRGPATPWQQTVGDVESALVAPLVDAGPVQAAAVAGTLLPCSSTGEDDWLQGHGRYGAWTGIGELRGVVCAGRVSVQLRSRLSVTPRGENRLLAVAPGAAPVVLPDRFLASDSALCIGCRFDTTWACALEAGYQWRAWRPRGHLPRWGAPITQRSAPLVVSLGATIAGGEIRLVAGSDLGAGAELSRRDALRAGIILSGWW